VDIFIPPPARALQLQTRPRLSEEKWWICFSPNQTNRAVVINWRGHISQTFVDSYNSASTVPLQMRCTTQI
jgi:hypothetical protein